MRKPAFCICENKDADQLRGDHEADQHLCFPYTDSIGYFQSIKTEVLLKFLKTTNTIWIG